MKKIFVIFLMFLLANSAFGSEFEDVKTFFESYVAASNNYHSDYFNYYSSNPTIIRVVVQKDGTTESVNVPFNVYRREANLGRKLGKLRGYKNYYSNITVEVDGEDYKLSALRRPSTSSYSLPAYFIIGKNENGEWKIKKEVMNTKVQTFLKRKNSG